MPTTTTVHWTDNLVKILQAQGMWGGVLATFAFIIIGYVVTRKGIFTKEINGKLSKFLISFALPFLCIIAFMQPANASLGKEIGVVIGVSIAFYVIAAVISTLVVKFGANLVPKLVTKKAEQIFAEKQTGDAVAYKDEAIKDIQAKLLTTVLMLSYGSLQFFAYPLVIAMSGTIFNGSALALAQIWCIPYMIGAFSYVMLSYSGEKFSKKNIKPILKAVFSPMMCALYLSLILWALQFAAPSKYAIVNSIPYQKVEKGAQFWAGFKANLPALGKILDSGVAIISPLAWMIIGGTLASSNLKKAAADKSVWVTTLLKLILMPLIMFLIGLVLVKSGAISASTGVLLTLLGATPPAAVCIIFSVAAGHSKSVYTAEVSSLSTLLCLVAMPIWIIIAYVTFN
ncbi:AEC family transporter [Mycoplasma zalophi]|uniref:Malate transporter n=1 Tax=Mycoplasma zalophi TaxID=191287 RepID=A0ABS6DPK8_9MOLU|nr:AEC family transporter [Mycoplasma zalophi]MBU4690971.1 malate transporter [Mycoplasma zalophi]MBU4692250.1 malate transporter [Mycoplasma zalophi]